MKRRLQITQEVIAAADVAAQDKARALCQLGDLASIGPTHDYKQAIEYYTKAIETADAIVQASHGGDSPRGEARAGGRAFGRRRCAWRGATGTRRKRSCRNGSAGRTT